MVFTSVIMDLEKEEDFASRIALNDEEFKVEDVEEYLPPRSLPNTTYAVSNPKAKRQKHLLCVCECDLVRSRHW